MRACGNPPTRRGSTTWDPFLLPGNTPTYRDGIRETAFPPLIHQTVTADTFSKNLEVTTWHRTTLHVLSNP